MRFKNFMIGSVLGSTLFLSACSSDSNSSAAQKENSKLLDRCLSKVSGDDNILQEDELRRFVKDIVYTGTFLENEQTAYRIYENGIKICIGIRYNNSPSGVAIGLSPFRR